eukprot:gene11363-7869_t
MGVFSLRLPVSGRDKKSAPISLYLWGAPVVKDIYASYVHSRGILSPSSSSSCYYYYYYYYFPLPLILLIEFSNCSTHTQTHKEAMDSPHPPENNNNNNNNAAPDNSGAMKAEQPAATTGAAQIALKVVNADGAEVFFKIKTTTQLKKLFDAYCKKQGINRQSVRFLFDGTPVDESKTPEDLGMEEEDVIDAMVEQTGGARIVLPFVVVFFFHFIVVKKFCVAKNKEKLNDSCDGLSKQYRHSPISHSVRAAVQQRNLVLVSLALYVVVYENLPVRIMTRVYSREELIALAKVMVQEVSKDSWTAAVTQRILQEPVPSNADELMNRYEEEQANFFTRYEYEKQNGAGSAPAVITDNTVGRAIVQQLQSAVLTYKDKQMEDAVTELATSVEGHMSVLGSSSPAIQAIFQKEQEAHAAGQHSHSHGGHSHGNGETCNHNHGHGAHSHSHGGQPCRHQHGHGGGPMGPGGPPPPLMMAAINSLSAEQKTTMAQVQQKMMRGGSLTDQEKTAMEDIQRHVVAFVQTMQQFMEVQQREREIAGLPPCGFSIELESRVWWLFMENLSFCRKIRGRVHVRCDCTDGRRNNNNKPNNSNKNKCTLKATKEKKLMGDAPYIKPSPTTIYIISLELIVSVEGGMLKRKHRNRFTAQILFVVVDCLFLRCFRIIIIIIIIRFYTPLAVTQYGGHIHMTYIYMNGVRWFVFSFSYQLPAYNTVTSSEVGFLLGCEGRGIIRDRGNDATRGSKERYILSFYRFFFFLLLFFFLSFVVLCCVKQTSLLLLTSHTHTRFLQPFNTAYLGHLLRQGGGGGISNSKMARKTSKKGGKAPPHTGKKKPKSRDPEQHRSAVLPHVQTPSTRSGIHEESEPWIPSVRSSSILSPLHPETRASRDGRRRAVRICRQTQKEELAQHPHWAEEESHGLDTAATTPRHPHPRLRTPTRRSVTEAPPPSPATPSSAGGRRGPPPRLQSPFSKDGAARAERRLLFHTPGEQSAVPSLVPRLSSSSSQFLLSSHTNNSGGTATTTSLGSQGSTVYLMEEQERGDDEEISVARRIDAMQASAASAMRLAHELLTGDDAAPAFADLTTHERRTMLMSRNAEDRMLNEASALDSGMEPAEAGEGMPPSQHGLLSAPLATVLSVATTPISTPRPSSTTTSRPLLFHSATGGNEDEDEDEDEDTLGGTRRGGTATSLYRTSSALDHGPLEPRATTTTAEEEESVLTRGLADFDSMGPLCVRIGVVPLPGSSAASYQSAFLSSLSQQGSEVRKRHRDDAEEEEDDATRNFSRSSASFTPVSSASYGPGPSAPHQSHKGLVTVQYLQPQRFFQLPVPPSSSSSSSSTVSPAAVVGWTGVFPLLQLDVVQGMLENCGVMSASPSIDDVNGAWSGLSGSITAILAPTAQAVGGILFVVREQRIRVAAGVKLVGSVFVYGVCCKYFIKGRVDVAHYF